MQLGNLQVTGSEGLNFIIYFQTNTIILLLCCFWCLTAIRDLISSLTMSTSNLAIANTILMMSPLMLQVKSRNFAESIA